MATDVMKLRSLSRGNYSVSSSCHNKTPFTGYLKQQKSYLLTVAEAENSWIKVQQGSFFSEASPPDLEMSLLSVLSHGRASELSGVSSYKASNPIRLGSHCEDFS